MPRTCAPSAWISVCARPGLTPDRSSILSLAFLGLLLFSIAGRTAEPTVNWPQFRGPNVDGLGEGDTLPESWSATENVVWKAEIPGWGWSSPIVWGNKIFVTSAVSEQPREKLVIGGYPGGRVKPTDVHRWMTYCIDFDSGKIVWEREAFRGIPPDERHPKNSYASATPSTDGERVYAYMDNIGLFCYDLDGKPLWEQRWGSFPMRGGWGAGASPVLHKDRIYFANDNERESFMVALDKTSGQEVWRVPREEKSNWSTPYVWEHDRTEIVTIGTNKIRSYDPDGKVLWELSGTSGLVSQTPLSKHGLLYAGAGYHYGPLYAIRPGASGDITPDSGATSNEWIAWSEPRGSSIHPCYLISGERLFVLYDAGLLACFHAKTGETIFPRQRLNTGGGRFYASPWAYNGKIFLLNEDGTTWVVEDAPEFKVVRKNTLSDYAWATPAIAQGSLFLRTYTGLYRLQNSKDVRQTR
ncbi:MAG TPA: PQQ-binding-like beta-propeller repeat protein [Pirellulaceae bacterium]|nr:PQQ-binding-like beta-propeller repeat protein [Pirellulaceae bacterium]